MNQSEEGLTISPLATVNVILTYEGNYMNHVRNRFDTWKEMWEMSKDENDSDLTKLYM